MIVIENLSKKYSGQYAIKNVGFQLGKKEILAIVGPSGSG